MWIKKEKYELLKSINEETERSAQEWRRLSYKIKNKMACIVDDAIVIPMEQLNELIKTDELEKLKTELNELKAELEWYKVKYHEMKMNADPYK